jgi:uncharacterized protein YraI
MKRDASAAILPGILLAVLLFVTAPVVRAGENAAVTGARVNLRAVPSSSGRVLETLGRGMRVEVLFVAGFSETVDGRDGSWCAIEYGGETGFVFGPFLVLDSGDIPTIEGPAYDRGRDLPLYFAETIQRFFGTDEAAVRARLGEPASVWDGQWGKCEGVTIRTLTYPEVEVELFHPTEKCGFASGREFVSGVRIKAGDRRILGIGVGSTVEDVRETLGWGFEDLALRSDLYVLHYTFEDVPQYVIDVIYKKVRTGDAVVREEVTEIRFIYNVLGD